MRRGRPDQPATTRQMSWESTDQRRYRERADACFHHLRGPVVRVARRHRRARSPRRHLRRRAHRPDRGQRLGQVDAPAPRGRRAHAWLPGRSVSQGRLGYLPQDLPLRGGDRVDELLGVHRVRAALHAIEAGRHGRRPLRRGRRRLGRRGARRRGPRPAGPRRHRARPDRRPVSPAGSARCSVWPGACWPDPTSCCSTSPPTTSTVGVGTAWPRSSTTGGARWWS